MYNFWSCCYGKVAAPLEQKPRMIGLELAAIQPRDKVLEVAVGPGASLLEIVKRVDRTNIVRGVDLAPKMIKRARRVVNGAGYTNINLQEADARQLPFPDSSFDVLCNSYMLDLIQLKDMPVVLSEFTRVLKPGGRLVLVNLSKRDGSSHSWYERFYTWLPDPPVPYVFGGCRPVLMEALVRQTGFCQVRQQFINHVIPSEIVTAEKQKL